MTKKFLKSKKLLITSLLAISTISLVSSLVLSSCAANNTNINQSNIVINNQSGTQEVIANDANDITLSIQASIDNNEVLHYQWYVDKHSNNVWEKIIGATNNTYKIPASSFQNISNETTWKYKVEIHPENHEELKIESQPILVKIKPSSNDSIPDKPNKPETNPSPKPPTNPEKPESPEKPVEPPTSPSEPDVKPEPPAEEPTPPPSQPDNPSTTPDPNEVIYPRNNTLGVLTTIKYDQEKWITDNSFSLLFTYKYNKNYLLSFVDEYLNLNSKDKDTNSELNNSYKLMIDFKEALESNNFRYNSSLLGTGWILDYSQDDKNKNLVDYYIATNAHVLNLNYGISFPTQQNVYGENVLTTATAYVPISKDSVEDVSLYISQPQYGVKDGLPDNLATDINQLNTQWYKTSLSKDNIDENLIPIGTFNSNGTPSLSTGYALSCSYSARLSYGTNNYNFYFPVDKSSGTRVLSKSENRSSDFSVLKIKENTQALEEFFTSQTATLYKDMFHKMNQIFKIDTDEQNVTKSSSYIARLNALLTMTKDKKTYDKNKVDELFMFADSKKDLNNNSVVSAAGFPGVTRSNGKFEVNLSSNTMSYSLMKNAVNDYNWIRNSIKYIYNGASYNSGYKAENNILMRNFILTGGASGAMAVDQNNKIVGLYWGMIRQNGTTDGCVTTLYEQSDNESLLKIWLKYVEQKDANSKLLNLFNNLAINNYFK